MEAVKLTFHEALYLLETDARKRCCIHAVPKIPKGNTSDMITLDGVNHPCISFNAGHLLVDIEKSLKEMIDEYGELEFYTTSDNIRRINEDIDKSVALLENSNDKYIAIHEEPSQKINDNIQRLMDQRDENCKLLRYDKIDII